MSTITNIPTKMLRPDDTLLAGASMVVVEKVEPDEYDERYWLHARCVSGNFDQWETPHHVDGYYEWKVLDARPGMSSRCDEASTT